MNFATYFAHLGYAIRIYWRSLAKISYVLEEGLMRRDDGRVSYRKVLRLHEELQNILYRHFRYLELSIRYSC